LQETIRTHGRQDRRKSDDVVLHDHIGPDVFEDFLEARIHEPRAVDQLPPDRPRERLDLLDGRLAKLGSRLADKVFPELSRRFLNLELRLEPHQLLLEALGRQRPLERFFNDEDHASAAALQLGANPDTVVRRAIGALRKKDDGRLRPLDL